MKNNEYKGKNGKGSIIAAVLLGILDILLLAALVCSVVIKTEKNEELSDNLAAFEENAEDYYQGVSEMEYASDVTISYRNTGAVSPEGTGEGQDEGIYAGFVFPNSNVEVLTDEQIAEKVTDGEVCRMAINEIYARHGFLFTKQENVDYFSTYEWYAEMEKESDMNAVSSVFTDIERSNVEKLQAYENSQGWNQEG